MVSHNPKSFPAVDSQSRPIVCPLCHDDMIRESGAYRCEGCGRMYPESRFGFYGFPAEVNDLAKGQDPEYVESQKGHSARVYREFIRPIIRRERTETFLDVGCGLGVQVNLAAEDGHDAYGTDLPNMEPYWHGNGNDPSHFFSGSATNLPFRSNHFDFVISTGVVEHIGTTEDTASLISTYKEARRKYAEEIIRVTKPGGRILISCPNKSFPIDVQHGPACGKYLKDLRLFIFDRTKMNIHKTWGRYHLLSYSEMEDLFCRRGKASSLEVLPLTGFFGFKKFQSGFLRPVDKLVRFYVDNLPAVIRGSCLNPYTLVLIRK